MIEVVRNKIIKTLESYEVKLQGDYDLNSAMPESFVTYYIRDSEILSYYNNLPHRINYQIDINYYAAKMSMLNSEPDLIFDKLLAAGFTAVHGKGSDAGLDKESMRYGWFMDFNYIYEGSINNG